MPYINSKGQTVYQGGESMPVASAPSNSTPIQDPMMQTFVNAMAKGLNTPEAVNSYMNTNLGTSGISYTPSSSGLTSGIQIPKTITASALGGVSGSLGSSPISLPSKPTYTNYSSLTASNNAGLANSLSATHKLDTATNTWTLVPENTAQSETEIRKQNLMDKLGIIPRKEDISQSPEIISQQAEVQKQKKIVNDYTSQLNAVTAKQNQDLLQLREVGSKEGVTEAVYGGQAATINREAAIKAIPLQAAVATAQGNLSLAQDYLTTLTNIRKEIIDNEYNYRVAQYDAISEYVTKEEKIRLDDLRQKNDWAHQTITDNINKQDAWGKLASQNGQSNVIPQINALNPASPTFIADLGRITAGITEKPNSSTPSGGGTFTKTQTNNGAQNAGLSIEEFATVPVDVKNYYINSSATEIKAMNGVFAEISAGTKTPEEVKTMIDSANVPPTVKDYLKAKVDSILLPQKGESFLSNVWNGIKGVLGF